MEDMEMTRFLKPEWTNEVLWPDPTKGPWRYSGTFVVVHGRLEPVGLCVRAPEGSETITALGWRQMPIGAITAELREQALAEMYYVVGNKGHRDDDRVAIAEHVLDELGEVYDPSTTGWPFVEGSEELYLEVARVYGQAWAAGNVGPVLAVQRHFNLASVSTARQWVNRARHRHGFLEPTTPSNANGRLTPLAKRLLAARHKKAS
jgi:hypothetical protein